LKEAWKPQQIELHPQQQIEHLNPLIAAGPTDGRLYFYRANAYAELGQWAKASMDYRQAIQRGMEGSQVWYRLALTQHAARDMEGYRQTCVRLVDRFRSSEDPGTAYQLAYLASLAEEEVIDQKLLLRLAENAVARKPRDYGTLTTLGIVLYRMGRFDVAVQRLNEADALRSPTHDVRHWFWLAMCHARLGHTDEARQWLDKGTKWVKQSLQRNPREATDPPPAWVQRLVLQHLHREAEALLR
jgi:Flp pilus assembly protein TadD